MEGFEWAQQNLPASTPHDLQNQGVNVYFAPNIDPDTKVVNLANGRVDRFRPHEDMPLTGYYANYDDLRRFCEKHQLPFVETNGQVSILPIDQGEAGDPLAHGHRP